MRLYLSSAYMRRAELARYAEELRAMGHEVTSSWHDVVEDFTKDDGHRMSATEGARAVIISRDLLDIRDCEVLLAFTEPAGSPYTRGTRHAEMGFAAGLRKRVWLIGEREENLFHWLGSLELFATWEECAAFLRRLKGS